MTERSVSTMKTSGNLNREAGILMPVSMLNGPHGIGDFGECARHFLRSTAKAGFAIWQLLPLNPLGYGNSPYRHILLLLEMKSIFL